MAKERIFELIRNEEVVLIVGAGMSVYAGYPSGAKLAEILHSGLTEELKKDIALNYDLPKLAEEIYNVKGGNKNYLFSTLKKQFQKEPISKDTHQILAKIPHFKNIITTNYDRLIESTNNNIEVIRKSTDYSIADTKKQLLFKIHSDLSDTENIILTTSDYNNYFSKSKEHSVFWNAVKDRLASNHILFIGYGLEDSNINVLLDKIIDELGDKRKEIFFVSPSINPAKLKYFQRIGIEYIESKGEILINEIYEDLKLNYFPNLSKGIGIADTALNFANENKISVTLSKKDEKIGIESITSSDKNLDDHLVVQFELTKNEETEKIIDSLKGKNFEDVNIDKNSLIAFNLFFKDFRFVTQDDIKNFMVKRLPVYDFKIHIVFEDDYEIDNYPFKLYVISPYENEYHLKIEVEDFTIIIKIKNNTKYHIEIFPSDEIKSTISGLKFYRILSKIVSNQKFKIYENHKLLFNYSPKISFDEDALGAKTLLEYFENLKKIEKFFDIRFRKIRLDKKHEESIKKIIYFIDKTVFTEPFNGHSFKIEDKDELDNFIKTGDKEKVLMISENEKTVIELYENKFDIGYLHTIIYDVFVENWEDIKLNKSLEIKLKSKSKLIHYQYSDSTNLISNLPTKS
ncbi:SIR2 family NAD-dependent protein deacylase [Flavobacterium sp. RSSB_23]|uniref:SIR2 family NAD-dependent protein deacylase n=1 Tax=Flavobacterium sp. RSSB_23 TaxID=3447668 RepID=UPI003F3D0E51